MARTYEIRIRFADEKSARSQFDTWSAQCDAGRSTIHGDHDRPRLVRLRDRTGPSVGERLATVEERIVLMGARMAQFEGHPAAGGTGILERLDALDSALDEAIAEHDALVERIGDLEDGDPAPVASPPAAPGSVGEEIEQATELLLSGLVPVWYLTEHEALAHGAKGLTTAEATARQSERFESRLAAKDAADAGEPVRPEPGSVVEPTPEQIEAYTWESPDWRRDREDDNKEMGHAFWHEKNGGHLVYPRYRGALEAVAKAEGVTPAEMRARILASSSPTAEDPDRLAKVAFHADRDPCPELGWAWENIHEEAREYYRRLAAAVAEACNQDRAALLARAEKAERLVNGCVAAIEPYIKAGFGEGDIAGLVQCVVADWQKRGEEIATLREPTPGSMLLSPTEWEVMLSNHTEARRDLEILRVSVAKLGTDANDILTRWDESAIPRVVYVQGHRLAEAVATIVETLREKPVGVQ